MLHCSNDCSKVPSNANQNNICPVPLTLPHKTCPKIHLLFYNFLIFHCHHRRPGVPVVYSVFLLASLVFSLSTLIRRYAGVLLLFFPLDRTGSTPPYRYPRVSVVCSVFSLTITETTTPPHILYTGVPVVYYVTFVTITGTTPPSSLVWDFRGFLSFRK